MRWPRLSKALAQVPDFNTPRLELEQYTTPPDVAAQLLLRARARGHIQDREVADLGSGTGRLGLGAALLGASRVILVEADGTALDQAREAARTLGVERLCRFRQTEVSHYRGAVDTVVMNPPFGSQRRRADRPFMEVALRTADHIHSLHLAVSRAYWEAALTRRGHSVEPVQTFIISLASSYPHHTRPEAEIDMVYLYVRPLR